MDLKAIADAIAGRFTGITATVNGSAEALTLCTASLPNTIAKGPVLLVYPPTGQLDIGTSARRDDLYSFPVMLLRDPLNVPTRTDALYAWYGAMHDRVAADMDLGLGGYVSIAEVSAVRMQIDGEEYAQALFDVVELTVLVRVNETVAVSV